MKKIKYLIDEVDYLEQLEKPKTKYIIKESKTKAKPIETPSTEEKATKTFKEIKPIYRYTTNGDLVDKYINASQMAKKLSWSEYYLNKAADQEKLFKGYFVTRNSYTKEKIVERFKPKRIVRKPKAPKAIKEKKPPKDNKPKVPYIQLCKVYQYNQDGELIATYDNCNIASNLTGWNRCTIKEYSKRERYYKGFLLSRVEYTPQQAKERFIEALNSQQMSYIYKDGNLVATCTALSEVKAILGTSLTLRKISYHKEKMKPINDYIISNKPLSKDADTKE